MVTVTDPTVLPSPEGTGDDDDSEPSLCDTWPTGRKVRVTSDTHNYLILSEVQVFDGAGVNVATGAAASQSGTLNSYVATNAIDGNHNGSWASSSATPQMANPWWEVELAADTEIHRIVLWNVTESASEFQSFTYVQILDAADNILWQKQTGWAEFFCELRLRNNLRFQRAHRATLHSARGCTVRRQRGGGACGPLRVR